jgi:hypothetical protein
MAQVAVRLLAGWIPSPLAASQSFISFSSLEKFSEPFVENSLSCVGVARSLECASGLLALRYGRHRQRGSARGQMQKLSPEKSHRHLNPPAILSKTTFGFIRL